MTTLASRLKFARIRAELTQPQLSECTGKGGVSQQMISKLERGEATETAGIVKLAIALGVRPEWLAEGKGPMLQAESDQEPSSGPTVHGHVPLISWVRAGEASEAIDALELGHGEAWIATTCPIHRHTYALRVEGDSMETKFPAGIIIVVEPELDPQPGDFVIAKNGGGEVTFKQLVKDGADWYLKPLNERYPIKPLGDSQVIGVVRESVWRLR